MIDLGLELFPEELCVLSGEMDCDVVNESIPVEFDQRSLSVRVYSICGLPHIHKLLHLIYLTSKILDFSRCARNIK